MNGQKQWTRLAVMALLVLAAMAAEGGKAEKQGESFKPLTGLLTWGKSTEFMTAYIVFLTLMLYFNMARLLLSGATYCTIPAPKFT